MPAKPLPAEAIEALRQRLSTLATREAGTPAARAHSPTPEDGRAVYR